MKKYKAQGKSGCTYGLKTEEGYYTQAKYPNGEFASVNEMDEGGRFGWKWWMSKYDPEQVDTFPDDCDLTEKL